MKLKEYSDKDLACDYDEVDYIWKLVQGCARADMIKIADPDKLGTAFGDQYALITVKKGPSVQLVIQGSIEGNAFGFAMPTLVNAYRRIDDLLFSAPDITLKEILDYCSMPLVD